MKTIYRDIVAALIFSGDGKLFMGKKDPTQGGVYPDCWHIPGGGVEPGETKIVALQRELNEEVGLVVAPDHLNLVEDDATGESLKVVHGETVLCKMKFYVFRVDLPEVASKIAITLTDDLVEYEWVSIDHLSEYNLAPPSQKTFRRLGLLPA